ncbi:MAG: hypothetical protein RSC12_04665 [Alistipes sp.]
MKRVFLFPTIEEGKAFILTAPKDAVFISGVGMAETAAVTIKAVKLKKPDLIILAGVAGAYDPTVPLGEVVEVVEERVAELPAKYAEVYSSVGFTPLKKVSANTVSRSGAQAGEAAIENMEGAAFFAVCRALGVDGCEIRALSNHVGEPFELWKFDEAVENLTSRLIQIFPPQPVSKEPTKSRKEQD